MSKTHDQASQQQHPFEGQTILLVDDDDVFRERLGRALERRRLHVLQAPSAEAARELVLTRRPPPELVLLDLRMEGELGLSLLPALVGLTPPPRVVVLTGYGSIATALEAVRLGATHYLQKPADADEILAAFRRPELGEDQLELEAPVEVPSLARAEWEHINRVLTECNGNIRKAARLLGLHRRTLQRKLAKYPSAH